MKAHPFALAAVCAVAVSAAVQDHARAELILQESFNPYQPGPLGGQGEWSGSDPSAVVDKITGGLRWSREAMAVDGGSASLRLTDHGSYKDYSQLNSMPMVNADAVYISFLVRGVGLDDYRDDTSLRVATNTGVGFSYHDGSPVLYAQRASGKYAWTAVEHDTTYLVVAKLWKSIGGTEKNYDRWTIFIDPTSPVEELNDVAFSLDGSTSRSYITTPRFWGDFHQDAAGKAVFYDEVKFGTTFSSVVPHAMPEPTTMSMLLIFSAMALSTRRRLRRGKR